MSPPMANFVASINNDLHDRAFTKLTGTFLLNVPAIKDPAFRAGWDGMYDVVGGATVLNR